MWTSPRTWVTGETLTATLLNTHLRDNLGFFMAGADVASASTITIDNQFHGVTGNTTINSLATTGSLVAGMQRRIWAKDAGGFTIANNGGGTGNIRTRSGGALVVGQNEIHTFVYDGIYWREQGGCSPRQKGTWAQLPISASVGTEFLLSDTWAGDGVTGVVASPISVLMKFTGVDATQPWEPDDTTHPMLLDWFWNNYVVGVGWQNVDSITAPAKITLRPSLTFGAQSTGGNAEAGWGTTAAGYDILDVTGGWGGSGTALADVTIAAAGKLYMSAGSTTGNAVCTRPHYQAKIVKMAGRA